MSRRWLRLTLAAPLMSFGAVAVDQVGPTWRFPGRSMLTGLFANALGWDWTERAAHQALQDRLVSAAALVREGEVLTDIQNAQLGANDRGWTTRGRAEGREGASYNAPHRRRRDFLADAELLVVLALVPADAEPSLDRVRDALVRPARPLFLGRKPCLPSRLLVAGTDADFLKAPTAHAALLACAGTASARAWWPDGEGPAGTRTHEVADLRNWDSGLHGGARILREGVLGEPASGGGAS
jgi:CRISPR system Cascade subunit CasD